MSGHGVEYIPFEVQAVRAAGANGKKLDCGSIVGAGGEDLFMQIAIWRQDINTAKTETTAAGGDTQEPRSSGNRRRLRRRRSTRGTAGVEVYDMWRFHQDRQRICIAFALRRWDVEVLLPNHRHEFGVHSVHGVP